ncbi:VanZ like family protein [Flavobacterium flevense]|nr:VanZ family protein [Flavobacterium flevense]SHL36845.1 VanZ like family protein [Flavobacterium flevense]
MLKKICLGIALLWTGIILYMCLVRMSELPAITIPYVDKFVHAFFYFVFSALWFYALRFYFKKQSQAKLLKIVFLMAFLFGIAIELFQNYLTTYRSGDPLDVFANTSGSLLAVLTIAFLEKNKNSE